MGDNSIDEPVRIVPYNPKWPHMFLKEKENLISLMKSEKVYLEHIGSTSIPGLSAKPIIDIMIGIKTYPPSSAWIDKVCTLGYTFHGEAGVPQRLYLTKRGIENFNLAVVAFDDGYHWKNNLNLRNYLRQNPEACREYENVKKAALESGANQLLSYSSFKHDFLENLFKKITKH